MFYSIGIQLKIGKKYWIGQDIYSGFSITLYGKNPKWLFWPTQYLVSSKVRVILKYTWRFLLQKMRVIISYLYWQRQRHPTPVLLPGKSHGRRSLAGCSPWGRKESDMTEQLHFHFSLLCIGEGNGNPLQYSCLENPRDGVAPSWTRLKWLSSSKHT